MRPRDFIKHAAFGASRHLGFNSLLRRLRRHRLLVVLYHGVIEAPKDPLGYTVHLREFGRQIEVLSRYFRPISLADLVAAAEGRATLPDRSVLVTFDDGYRNNLVNAAPILRRYGVPAVIHVATGYIGAGRILWVEEICLRIRHWPLPHLPMPAGQPDCPMPADTVGRASLADRVSISCKDLSETEKQCYLARLREIPLSYGEDYIEEAYAFMSWDEVRQLQAQGFEIGAHTVNHPILSALDPKEAAWEVSESKRVVEEQLGHECVAIGYPNGRREDISDAVIEAARTAGYKVGFLQLDRFNPDLASPLALTRINVLGYLPERVFHSRISGLIELLH